MSVGVEIHPDIGWLDSDGGQLAYYDIAAAATRRGARADDLPYALRILLENLCRSNTLGGPGAAQESDIRALLDWRSGPGIGVPLQIARVILPDSSGLPVLLDLAALRDAVAQRGGDPLAVDPRVQVDLIVDHSLQVDVAGTTDAMTQNMTREFERNAERYRFLKWAQGAFHGLRVFPPGTGIIHQINLEFLATIVITRQTPLGRFVLPDFVIGGDSHTPMVNALGVLGWGVGGLDAEAVMLGQPYVFPIPQVVGVRLTGRLPPAATTTDLALLVTETLRRVGVVGRMVEFIGPGVAILSIPERATIANMTPEYGATCGFFPVDRRTLDYMRLSGRSAAQVRLIETYCRANHLWRDPSAPEPGYAQMVEIDLGTVRASMAGPRRPQDRLPIGTVSPDFRARLTRPLAEGGFGLSAETATHEATIEIDGRAVRIGHGTLAIAAITSCTNTSNPSVMLTAGLIAKRAVEIGLRPPGWVKTSLAPGSRVVSDYLQSSGLQDYLDRLGFQVIGYGCTTCGGKSGPLHPAVSAAIERSGLIAAAALSGNRNFEGRIHRQIRANYIGSPPLVLLYALAGRIDIDLATEPVGLTPAGVAVHMRDLWPSPEEIESAVAVAVRPERFRAIYAEEREAPELWRKLEAPRGSRFGWDRASLYMVEPPFLSEVPSDRERLPETLTGARALGVFGDSLTTDHISPGGEIPPDTPAGRYLLAAGVAPRDFNTYVARRCNHHVMARATFTNIRIKNALVPGVEGGVTRLFPDGTLMPIFEAATIYGTAGTPVIVLAGAEYGTGSSRDWAAKGSALLGVRAVIAESFERIHRANLAGMGIVPLRFATGEGWRQLGLRGTETFEIRNLRRGVLAGEPIEIRATGADGTVTFQVAADILTDAERHLIRDGGMLPSVLQHYLTTSERPGVPASTASPQQAKAV